MTNLKKQFERLKRHYKSSIEHYDTISFLDLTHTLRVWTELKNKIKKLDIKNGKNFKRGVLTNKVRKILSGSEYIYFYLPEGVTTSASATDETEGRIIINGPIANKFSTASLIKIENNGDLTIAQFLIIYQGLSQGEIKILNDEAKKVPIEKIHFSKYLESCAINFRFFNYSPRHISNENLINRIANEYEASHINPGDSDFDLNNVFSEPIKKLMQHECARLPLPYFVLLHIAKNIIENFEGQF